jgi:hypothetical protein
MKIDEHRLKTYVAQGRKYLDALWDAIAEKKQPWNDGRIRLWLNPRLGRPPWLCGEIWAKYAADRKAASKTATMPKAASEAPGKVSGLGAQPKPASGHPGAAGKGKHR